MDSEPSKPEGSDQPSSSWATFGTISAILAIAVALGAFAEGLRRWSRPVNASTTTTISQTTAQAAPKPPAVDVPVAAPKPVPRTKMDDDARRAEALKRLEMDVAEAEARRASIAATQNAIAQAESLEQLDSLAALYPELAPAIDIRRTVLAEAKRQQETVEKAAAEVELATVTDTTRIAEISARWPALQPQVEARLASLKTESEKKEPDAKTAAHDRITRAAQDGLRRAGCFSGPSTGTWGPKTKKATETYNTHAKTKITIDAPTEAAETVLGAVKTRVCPVACDAPKVAVEGKCVAVTCAAGTVPAVGGVCEQAFVAWVGSHETQTGAEAIFAGIQQAHAELLRDRPPEIKAAASVQRYSVRIGPAASKDAIRDLCAKLKGAGMAAKCYPAPI